jgi:cysteine desulfurase
MAGRIYLDWNATTPLRPEARDAMLAALGFAGNPSSVHAEGRAARRIVETARQAVAKAVGAQPASVIFTSGGTEANALALTPSAAHPRLLVSAIEHASVLAGGRFPASAVTRIAVQPDGRIDLDDLRAKLAEGPPALVAVMLANNETGVIQPVAEAATLVHAAGGRLHVDAVQALGKIAVDVAALGADTLALSAHKIGGPTGVGALVVTGSQRIEPLIGGGGQEQNRRAGTENLAGIAGFGAAVGVAMAEQIATADRVKALRDQLESGLKATPDVVIFGDTAPRLPNTILYTAPHLKAETALIGFDLAGIAVSSGSACSSGKVQPSHVLAAMGVTPEQAKGAIRVSLGWLTTETEAQSALEAWRKLADTLLKA